MVCNELCTAAAMVEMSSKNDVTISFKSWISEYLADSDKFPLKVGFQNTYVNLTYFH